MARKQTGRGPMGRPPKPDGDERAKLVAFRVHDLRDQLDKRGDVSKRGTVARRDLQRYYSLIDSSLKSIDADSTDIGRLYEYLKDETEIKGRVTVRLFAPMVRAAAVDSKISALEELSDVQVMALLDLFSRTDSSTDAAKVFLAETGA